MAQVSLKQIAKRYGDTSILHGVDLEIADGEFVVFVGPSGCGKSTLLRMIAGLEEISGGELRIGQRIANDVPPAQRGIAMVFQSYALYPHMTVFDNMAFALQLARHGKAEIKQAVERAADTLQITHLLQRKPKDLSGGQRQRVAIGRAIVRKPEVFLFDEPLSNLDASLRVQMRVELSRLHRELGTTMIYVTHDQVEAMTLGQRIVVINQGRIEQVGTPFELYNNPGNLFVAGFLGSPKMNLIPAQVDAISSLKVRVRLDSGAIVEVDTAGAGARIGDKVTLGVRAEHLAPTSTETDNRIDVTVGHVEYLGDQTVVYASLPGCPGLIAARLQAAPAGSAMTLHLPAAHCHLFDAQGRAFTRSA